MLTRKQNKFVKKNFQSIFGGYEASEQALQDIRKNLAVNREFFMNLALDQIEDCIKNKAELNIYLESHRRIREIREQRLLEMEE